MPKIETTSKASLKPPSRIDPRGQGAPAESSTLDTAHKLPPTPPPQPGKGQTMHADRAQSRRAKTWLKFSKVMKKRLKSQIKLIFESYFS